MPKDQMSYCIDSPCCGCCDFNNEIASPELADEMDQAEMYPDDEPFDGFLSDAEADGEARVGGIWDRRGLSL